MCDIIFISREITFPYLPDNFQLSSDNFYLASGNF
jgi:hypothetical protein